MTVKEGFGNRGIGNLECITHKTGRSGPVWFLLESLGQRWQRSATVSLISVFSHGTLLSAV